jgi:hypothetical protein
LAVRLCASPEVVIVRKVLARELTDSAVVAGTARMSVGVQTISGIVLKKPRNALRGPRSEEDGVPRRLHSMESRARVAREEVRLKDIEHLAIKSE